VDTARASRKADGNAFAACTLVAHVLLTYRTQLTTAEGGRYTARACGRERDDGTWEGWLEFVPADGSEVLRSARETTQPNQADLEYWATGLTPVYLEGAFTRAMTPPPIIPEPTPTPLPAYEGPKPSAPEPDVDVAAAAPREPVLNPFSVYAKGEGLLRRQLAALSARHLRTIITAFELAEERQVDLEVLTEQELIALIVVGVRTRLAA
jgi:hypothetical protein